MCSFCGCLLSGAHLSVPVGAHIPVRAHIFPVLIPMSSSALQRVSSGGQFRFRRTVTSDSDGTEKITRRTDMQPAIQASSKTKVPCLPELLRRVSPLQ